MSGDLFASRSIVPGCVKNIAGDQLVACNVLILGIYFFLGWSML